MLSVPGEGRGGRTAALRQNRRMASYALNKDAVAHATRLIDARQYVVRSRWQDVQPRAREQNAFLRTHSFADYALWHLGLTEAPLTRRRHATRLCTATFGGCTGWA
jgi:hypothetical protein